MRIRQSRVEIALVIGSYDCVSDYALKPLPRLCARRLAFVLNALPRVLLAKVTCCAADIASVANVLFCRCID